MRTRVLVVLLVVACGGCANRPANARLKTIDIDAIDIATNASTGQTTHHEVTYDDGGHPVAMQRVSKQGGFPDDIFDLELVWSGDHLASVRRARTSGDGLDEGIDTTTLTYDGSRLSSGSNDPAGVTTLAYDSSGRITSIAGPTSTQTRTLTYGPDGSLASVDDVGANGRADSSASFTYDRGKLKSIGAGASGATNVVYADERVSALVSVQIPLDAQGQPVLDASGQPISQTRTTTLSFDDAGRVAFAQTLTEDCPSCTPIPQVTLTYEEGDAAEALNLTPGFMLSFGLVDLTGQVFPAPDATAHAVRLAGLIDPLL